MRGMTRRWILRPSVPTSPIFNICGGTGVLPVNQMEPLPARILAARRLADTIDMARFCDPRLTHLHDPSLIPDLDRAAVRILAAVRAAEPIAIWGDYDVDGVTAAAILHRMIRTISPDADICVYLPHRLEEGYGLNTDGVAQLAEDGVRLIITVDCGVTAIEPAKLARTLSVDLIITDHHIPPASLHELPDAFAVVHPGRPDSDYPFKDLSGAGVAYKLAWRLATLDADSERLSETMRTLLVNLLSLAALGTIADVVPLLDENRVLARFGLSRLKTSPFTGVQALIAASRLTGAHISSEDVGFRLAPRLNACGRLGHASEALQLLISTDPVRSAHIARELTQLNEKRQSIERYILEHAVQLAEDAGMTAPDRRAIVLAHEDWHPGVLGIVCSRLVERYARPTILLRRFHAECQGSCRSVDGYDIHAALTSCADHLSTYGGHAMAAGLRLPACRLESFTEAFTENANRSIAPDDLIPALTIDCEATLDELNPRALEEIEKLSPFGRGNPHPVVLLRNLTLESAPQAIGAGGRHLALHVRTRQDLVVRLLAWNWGAKRTMLRAGSLCSAVVEPKRSVWRGVVRIEPHLRDLALDEPITAT